MLQFENGAMGQVFNLEDSSIGAVIYGEVANAQVAALQDLDRREFWLLGALAAAVLLMGVWPGPFIDVMHVSVVDLLAHVAKTKL